MFGGARVVTANRSQTSYELLDLEEFLPPDHRARAVVAFVARLDLSPFYAVINARDGEAGRPALDPAILLGLWLLATTDGIGSARLLERLTENHMAYRWLRGGMPLNPHTLSDFRTVHAGRLDRVLTESLAAVLAEGLVKPVEIIIDGTKIKANAGRNSFKTAKGLADAEVLAAAQVARLKAELEDDGGKSTKRQKAARQRAADEAAAKVAAAKDALDKLLAEKAKRAERHKSEEAKKAEPKASTTDPDARIMRFSDGSSGPGYNVQVAVTSGDGFIVGIVPTDRRNDRGLAHPMLEEVERRLGLTPDRILVDTGYASAEDIIALTNRPRPVTVYASIPPEKAEVKEATKRRRSAKIAREPQALKEWRARMASLSGQVIMKRRKRIELVNAHLKFDGLGRPALRGLVKLTATACLNAIAHNLRTALRIRAIQAAEAA